VDGAVIFSYIGARPPAPEDSESWRFEGLTSRRQFSIHLPSSTPPGTTVWITARWFNRRKQLGPAAQPSYANIPGWLQQSAAQAASSNGAMALAA
jgi:hypothetical protein